MDDRITIAGNRMRVAFDSFGIDDYSRFLRAKSLPEWEIEFDREREKYAITAPARFARLMGVDVPAEDASELPFLPCLYDDQVIVTRLALAAMRFAVWSDCGWGKTLVGLEYARQVLHRTGGRVLIFTRNEIIKQWLDTAVQFYRDGLPLVYLGSREKMKAWAGGDLGGGLAITNYEKMNYAGEGAAGQVVREFGHLAGVILDEGSRLRTAGGKQKWALIKSCEQIPYRLVLTATPAPNDLAEFMSQAGFLGYFRAEHSINTYFSRDAKSHRWTVRPHARPSFFKFMATWSIYIRDPRRYGWRQGFPTVPEPIVTTHRIEATDAQLAERRRILATGNNGRRAADLFAAVDTNTIERSKLSQVAKGFRYVTNKKTAKRTVRRIESLKPAFIAGLIRAEREAGHRVLVWTVFDAEAELIAEELRKFTNKRGDRTIAFEELHGHTPAADRIGILERFRTGDSTCLIGKAAMLGFGLNLQHCDSMIFSGWTDGYEAFYQALRRAYRPGQTKRLRVHVPLVEELEGDTWNNILRKQHDDEQAIAEMEAEYIRTMGETGQLTRCAA